MDFRSFQLDQRLLDAVAKAGYVEPTPIQVAAIPPALAGEDIVGTAQTGTGKTAAFVLPILHRLLAGGQSSRTRALVVTPTRELAEQINDAFRMFADGTWIRSATVYGGVAFGPQVQALRKGVEVIVACPGRLLDQVQRGAAKLGGVEVLVIDEADRMFDMGFLPDVRRIIKLLARERQTMLFSATFPPEIEYLADENMRNPKRVELGLRKPVHTVAHSLYPVMPESKTPLLLALLEKTRTDSVLIFTRTKHRANRLARQIEGAGYRVTSLHGNRSQNQRQEALDGFRSGKYLVLVATDIAARGLDIDTISHVINYDMPDTPDAYIHRIGRTGRAERSGDAFTLVTPEDRDMIRNLEKIMGCPLLKESMDGFDEAIASNRHLSKAVLNTLQPAPPVKSVPGIAPANRNMRRGRHKRR